jgi:predicted RND superfamily exporter protein
MTRLADWLVAHGRWVVGAVLLVSLVLGAAALRLRLDFRYSDLLPQGHPFIEVHNRYHRNFSEANVLTVMVEAREGTIYSVPVLDALFRLTEAVDRLPGVNHDQVASLAHRTTRWVRVKRGGNILSDPVMLRAPTTETEAEEVRRLVRSASYVLGLLVSLDERAAIIRAGFHEQRVDYRRLFNAVDATILPLADEHTAVYVSGPPRLNGWILALEDQVVVAFAAAVLLTWILLWAYFRDWRGALRPTISGGLAAVWGFGLMQLTGFALNPLTLVIPFLITARAVSHSAQMHDRYYEELDAGTPKVEAIRSTFARLFAPTAAGILTDALGVLAIALVAIPALRQLAVSATLWLLSLLVTELLLNPIVYARLRPPAPAIVRARAHAASMRAASWLGAAVTSQRGRLVTLASGAAVLAIALGLLPFARIGDPSSASRILTTNSEYNQSHAAVQGRFGGSEPLLIVAEGDRPRALYEPGVLRTMEAFQRYLERVPVVAASVSSVDLLKAMGERFHELEPKWGVIPESQRAIADLFLTYWISLPPSTSAQFFTPDLSTAQITFFCADHTVPHVRAVIAAARDFIAAHPLPHVQFRLAGGFIGIMAAVYDEIQRSQALMTVASFLVIFVVVLVTYRSVVAALLLIAPLVLANVVVNAYMAARGIGLDLDTLPVIAVGVGFGIDYGIYVLSRVGEAVERGATLEAAVSEAIAQAGRTVGFTAVTMTAGILCFTPTALRFVGEMAALLALWMITSGATALTILPALVVTLRPRFLARRA